MTADGTLLHRLEEIADDGVLLELAADGDVADERQAEEHDARRARPAGPPFQSRSCHSLGATSMPEHLARAVGPRRQRRVRRDPRAELVG
jgi:hypothetical protein